MNNRKLLLFIPIAIVFFVVGSPHAASATSLSGGYSVVGSSQTLPWESALGGLASGLTGTTARIISIIAIFIAGIALILGEDLGQFARRLLMIVIAVAFLVGAGSFIAPFTTGASIF
jgi:type IV secretion system protein VirB2